MSWILPPYQIQRRKELEQTFALTTTSNLLGLLLIPSVYSLRLLPTRVAIVLVLYPLAWSQRFGERS